MTTVFISYRHQDADAFADAVYEEFERRLGAANVFLDVKGLEYGTHFSQALSQRIRQASVVLVLVGSQWIDARDAKGKRRLDLEDDWVRIEQVSSLPSVLKVARLRLTRLSLAARRAATCALAPITR